MLFYRDALDLQRTAAGEHHNALMINMSSIVGKRGAAEKPAGALVEVTTDGHVATISLANPGRRNVLDLPMAAALREATARVESGPEVRCVVVTGSEDIFAAGADINEIGEAEPRESLDYNRQLRAAINTVATLPVPTIAAVNGHAVGGGLELALACTLRIAAAKAKIGVPEAQLGIIPATGGLARLPRLVGRSTAARLLLTGDLISGEEAARLGIVDAAVTAEQVLPEATKLAQRIASAAPLSTRAIVDSLNHDEELPIAEANDRAEDRLATLLETADRREGARAFLERREPEFRGS